ncbi:hypothetical protein LA080_001548 [Diaporthe eres]|nr:hypothetical protein LA080_001548 [Diaporthe eres]
MFMQECNTRPEHYSSIKRLIPIPSAQQVIPSQRCRVVVSAHDLKAPGPNSARAVDSNVVFCLSTSPSLWAINVLFNRVKRANIVFNGTRPGRHILERLDPAESIATSDSWSYQYNKSSAMCRSSLSGIQKRPAASAVRMNSRSPRAPSSAPCVLGPLPLSGVHALDCVYESNSRTKPIPIFHNVSSSCSTHPLGSGWVSANDLSPCQAVGTAPSAITRGEWGRSLLVMLRLWLLEWNAKSGLPEASIRACHLPECTFTLTLLLILDEKVDGEAALLEGMARHRLALHGSLPKK